VSEPILFVDDTPETLDVLVRICSGEFEAHAARSAKQAIELFEQHGPFAVVVSDYEMPGERGSELVARLRERWPETVAILLTGLAELDVAVDALHNGGVFRFLEKPCPRGVLAAALHDALAEHRRRCDVRAKAEAEARSRRTLQQQNGQLEDRIHAQMRALARLQQFVGELNSCETLERVAAATAQAACEVCELEGARVEFRMLPRASSGRVESVCGRIVALDVERVTFATTEGELGALELPRNTRSGRALDATDHDLIASIAASASVAARNVLRRCERDDAQQATIFALAKLAEQRDNETGRHLERVSTFCRLIAEGLRGDGHFVDTLSDTWISVLEKSAPLHDIGKVGIPDHILHKPGKHTPEEWEIMMTHAKIGSDAIWRAIQDEDDRVALDFMYVAMEISHYHHEKWNGSGYPDRLHGEQIPLPARLMALGDVFDALISKRVYKPAFPIEKATEIILEGRGTHFDPDVVDAYVARIDDFRQIALRYTDAPGE
jgi:response regulator RpfG family c-di-GMP phosphodiesterase